METPVPNHHKEDFLKWLQATQADPFDALIYTEKAFRIHRFMLDEGISRSGLLDHRDVQELNQAIEKVKQNANLPRSGSREYNFWMNALALYAQFAAQGFLPSPVQEEPPRSETAATDNQPEEPEETLPGVEENAAPETNDFTPKIYRNLEEDFRQWLAERQPDLSADEAVSTLSQATGFARQNHLSKTGFFGVPVSTAAASIKRLLANRFFMRTNGRTYTELRRLAPCYFAFLEEVTEKAAEETAQNEKPAAPAEPVQSGDRKNTPPPENPVPPPEAPAPHPQALEPALAKLLEGPEYEPLRAALLHRGITTEKAFQGLNLWVFLNSNGLYSIGKRYEVYRTLQRSKFSPANGDNGCQIKTKHDVYSGSTPAHALLAFCETLAVRHPLSFQAQIGARCQDTVVLMPKRLHLDDLAMEHPEAYLDAHLSYQTALRYAEWLAKKCNDFDRPVSVPPASAEPTPDEKPEQASSSTSAAEAQADSDISQQFFKWMLEDQHMPASTCRGYVSGVRKAERFAAEWNYPNCRLFTADRPEAAATAKALFSDNVFLELNLKVHHNFSAAIAKLFAFYGMPWALSPEMIKPAARPEKPAPKPAPVPVPAPSRLAAAEQIEAAILKRDVQGLTLNKLIELFPRVLIKDLKKIGETSPKIIDLQDRYVHVDALVDLAPNAKKLRGIIEKLLVRNDGYVSAAQLYDYACTEIPMFLNDNDLSDEKSVYCLCRHLFCKGEPETWAFDLTSGNHIARRGAAALQTNLDVVQRYVWNVGGFFNYKEMEQYLTQIGVKTGNLRSQMKLGTEPLFFYYSSEELLSVESMKIDRSWLDQAKTALDRLFDDVGDHIVLRTIRSVWYDRLPPLPGNRPWTPLLLQYAVRFYGDSLGARTIQAMPTQSLSTLHAMLVSDRSEIRTFPDAVAAYILDHQLEERVYDAEELRHILVQGKMIAGNELIWNMHKALDHDPRFLWDISNKNVHVRM